MKNKKAISISELGIEGAELLSVIHKEAFYGEYEQKWEAQDFIELFSIPGTVSYLISFDGQPIGFILIRSIEDEAEIITFCILPKWFRNGYASYLLEWVINTLQKQSVKRLFLEVRENNDAAIKLYQKCSFKIIGRRKGYYKGHHGEITDALVMQIQL
ncbi:MAG: ribosomal protein S18-alanine N-acetyltransferase [Kordiimonadaceae bacterium]|nr:ribosomal protein S18-alanine N-acetyltransferase [Kordiimonadaceae bacterium]